MNGYINLGPWNEKYSHKAAWAERRGGTKKVGPPLPVRSGVRGGVEMMCWGGWARGAKGIRGHTVSVTSKHWPGSQGSPQHT